MSGGKIGDFIGFDRHHEFYKINMLRPKSAVLTATLKILA